MAEKKVRITLEMNNSFLRLLKAEISLSQMQDKDENTPSQLLAMVAFGEAAGDLEVHIDNIMPADRFEELKAIHEERKVLG